MTDCFLNCRFYRNFFLKLHEQPEKIKIKNLLLMTYVEKTTYFEVAPPCHTMLTNTLIMYFKKISMHPNLFYSGLKILSLRNFQNLIDVP